MKYLFVIIIKKLLIRNVHVFFGQKNQNPFSKQFWLNAYVDYGEADERYIKENGKYVYIFELINVLSLIPTIFALYFYTQNDYINMRKSLVFLLIQGLSCVLYYITYFMGSHKITINMKTILWMLFSLLWAIVPLNIGIMMFYQGN